MCILLTFDNGYLKCHVAIFLTFFSQLNYFVVCYQGAVHSMMFTEDGKYILSSGIGERYVAVWRIDGSKKQAASCVLAMEHPAVTLDCKCSVDDEALSVLAVSEVGLCYLWHGKNIEELRKSEPTKISLSIEEAKNQKGILPIIFAAKLQGITKPSARNIFVAHGLLIKPSFEKILVHYGEDVTLKSSRHGVLLPISQSHQSKKGQDARSGGKLGFDVSLQIQFFFFFIFYYSTLFLMRL